MSYFVLISLVEGALSYPVLAELPDPPEEGVVVVTITEEQRAWILGSEDLGPVEEWAREQWDAAQKPEPQAAVAFAEAIPAKPAPRKGKG